MIAVAYPENDDVSCILKANGYILLQNVSFRVHLTLSDHFQSGAWVLCRKPDLTMSFRPLSQSSIWTLGICKTSWTTMRYHASNARVMTTIVCPARSRSRWSRSRDAGRYCFIIGPHYFMTISRTPLVRLDRFTSGAVHFATTHQLGLLTQIMDQDYRPV